MPAYGVGVDAIWPFVAVLLVLVAVLGGLTWLGGRVRRRGIGGDVMAQVDQVFRPTAHQSHYEIRAEAERGVGHTSPDRDRRRTPPARGGPDRRPGFEVD